MSRYGFGIVISGGILRDFSLRGLYTLDSKTACLVLGPLILLGLTYCEFKPTISCVPCGISPKGILYVPYKAGSSSFQTRSYLRYSIRELQIPNI